MAEQLRGSSVGEMFENVERDDAVVSHSGPKAGIGGGIAVNGSLAYYSSARCRRT